LLDGTVGPAAAAELIAFLRLFRQLPSIDEILLNPETAPLPAETSAQIAIATALGRAMTDNSVARGLKYLDRMPTEMRVMAMRDAAARDTAITHTPEFIRFGVEHRRYSMITERAMLAAVHISIWTAVKHDRKISRDVADQHGAHQGAGRYNKQLLRGADKLDELRTLAGQVRQYFYKITLPWSDEGFRLLPSNLYFDLTTRMREFEASFEQGVESFLQVYPQYIEQVRPELNGLFREEDYPAADKLRKKFGVKLEILPIPSGNDFRVQMSAEEQARVAREIDANVRQSLTRGTEDLWKRLREVVSHMVDRLNEPESRFHATMVTNVFDLVELLPRLNVNGDAELNRFAEQIRQRLCGFTAQDLKKHDLLRVAAATDAAEIVAEIDSVLRDREASLPEAGDSIGREHPGPYVCVHGGARGGMRHETPAGIRIQKARTTLLLDHPFFRVALVSLEGA
jgi:hypothetical protein